MAKNVEDAKNMALLFFMDHLMQKTGKRTIHDLSCQFGARGFTPEMREAVGTTQEGLTEFLSQFPSLFDISGDEVGINAFGDLSIGGRNTALMENNPSRNRDYEEEAVQFFEAKLKKFGPELQIKSLLGHRSQAAPEFRLVSGRHLKDFSEFLQSRTDHFIVEGDRVRLKNMPEPLQKQIELDTDGKPLMGIRAKQATVDYLRGILDEDQSIPLDQFYQSFCDRFSHSVRQEVATNPKELLQFLKLNRAVFFIRSNKVSLVKNRVEGSDSGGNSMDGDANNEKELILPSFNSTNPIERITLLKALKPAQVAIGIISAESVEIPVISVDFKTVGLQNHEFLTLVVVGTISGQLYVFDLAHSDSIILESGLKDLLESSQLKKVLHDGRRVASILAQQYGIHMRSIFDTQVAHSVMQHEKFGKALHEIKGISFVNLQRVYYPESIMMSDVTPRTLSQCSFKTWSVRPLTGDILINVVEEARFLVPALYKILNNALPSHIRPFFEEKCAENLLPNLNRSQLNQQLASDSAPYRKDSSNSSSTLPYRPPGFSQSRENGHSTVPSPPTPSAIGRCGKCTKKETCDSSSQTFATGEITASAVYYDH